MPKGGARMGSGPPPNPQSRKQTGSQAGTWTDLPANGYQGTIPEWPLGGMRDRDAEVWHQIWRTPQAAAWIQLGWTIDVAMYVSFVVSAFHEDTDLAPSLKSAAEARQWSDRLGLNPAAMLRNRWRVRVDEVDEKRTEKSAPAGKSRRLKVVDDAVARG